MIRILSVPLFFLMVFMALTPAPLNHLRTESTRKLQAQTKDRIKTQDPVVLVRGSGKKIADNSSDERENDSKVVTKAQSIESIERNPESELFKDILTITHNPQQRRIKVTLTKNAKCSRPVLRGRLSGRALSIIKWDPQESRMIKGHYEVPFTGEFFLEIIALFCEYEKENLDTSLVPGETHRLTVKGTVINVVQSSDMKGYWESSVNEPLYTRWQPQNCRDNNKWTSRCSGEGGPGDPRVFDKYRFRTAPALEEQYSPFDTTFAHFPKWNDKWNAHNGYNCLRDYQEDCDLCAIGSSHSSRLHRMYTELTGTTKSGGLRDAYPEDISDRNLDKVLKRCKNIVVGFGQHDIAYTKTPPHEFAQKIRDLLRKLETHPRVFGRSVNYNPLGDEKLMSPPQDSRNPVVVDEYNDAVQAVYVELNRPWIDTRWITEAMWDSAPDWNHMHYSVEFVQTFYIADYLGIPNPNINSNPVPKVARF